MAESEVIERAEEAAETVSRIYEIGYHISPSVKEEDLDTVIGGIRSAIEKEGGSFIAEGAPSLMRLSYAIEAREAGKKVDYDRGYFGWIKFESSVPAATAIEDVLRRSPEVFRFIVFRTVREDTRAKFKAPTLREVKRTDTLKTTPRRAEENAAPVSEEDLDKALQDITAD